jgi:GLPGLI family protein
MNNIVAYFLLIVIGTQSLELRQSEVELQEKHKGVVVDYEIFLNDRSEPETELYALHQKLRTNGENSYQELVSYVDTTLYDAYGNPAIFESKQFSNSFNYYKNIKSHEVNYGASLTFGESAFISDNPSFNFTEGKQEKKILEYDCKQLIVSFRGRDYEIFYTPDLKYSDGPWKFMGAPGLILEVTSFDETVKMRATNIEKLDDFKMIPVLEKQKKRKELSYREFILKRSKWREMVKSKLEAEDPTTTIGIPYRNFEIYLPYFIDNHR